MQYRSISPDFSTEAQPSERPRMTLLVLRDEDAPAYDDAPPSEERVQVMDEGPRFAMLWESVLFDPELTPVAKVVYAVLQRYAARYGGENIHPSHDQIALDAGVKNRKTVAAALDALEKRGHLRRETRGFSETRRIILTAPAQVRKTDISICPKNGHMVSEKRTKDVQKTDTIKRDTERERERGSARAKPSAPKGRPSAPETLLDPAFVLDERMTAFAVERGWQPRRVELEFQKFRAHHEEKQTLSRSWPASWRTWVLRGIGWDERDAARGSKSGRPRNPNAGGTGEVVL